MCKNYCYRASLKQAAQRKECWRRKVPSLIDSQVVVNVIARDRSSSHQLNYVLQTSLAVCLFCHTTPLPMWIGTEENPADDPTRGRELRQCLALDAQADRAIASLGYPGEGPKRKEMPVENKGQDL
eukprot:2959052-Amphidinium_carterae.2